MVLKSESPRSGCPVGSALGEGPQWTASWQGKEIIWKDRKAESDPGVRLAHDDDNPFSRTNQGHGRTT